jgi:putative flippase GtrA
MDAYQNSFITDKGKTVIVIPAYRPDHRLSAVVKALSGKSGPPVLVIDDGSGPAYAGIFNQARLLYGCTICAHGENRGKGAALKTGIREAARLYPAAAGIVTADADGQHAPADILRVAEALAAEPESLILGARDFSGGNVPSKSRWGNRVTSAVFGLAAGTRCKDTQTGLRGLPLPFAQICLNVPGERFEYEFNVLLRAAKGRLPFREVEIQTIYQDGNSSSHFRAFRDSARIYANFLRFGASSLCSALADLSFFTLFTALLFGGGPSGILYSTVLARILSGVLNFTLNRQWVFKTGRRRGVDFAGYAALFLGQMLASWLLVTALSGLLTQLTAAKALVDSGLFILSYFVQKDVIFRQGAEILRKGGRC